MELDQNLLMLLEEPEELAKIKDALMNEEVRDIDYTDIKLTGLEYQSCKKRIVGWVNPTVPFMQYILNLRVLNAIRKEKTNFSGFLTAIEIYITKPTPFLMQKGKKVS